ncbi:hypothetical protein ERD78_18710 [Allopusillimonas soli]|uniref:Lipoprotein n=1 Tax=Allopusillimonas soli TaxID=659016 RepID=A0A853FKK0_9BURK|nr:hypothetical protein [Allopusillimonas soli]NYT38901.1 hypothetical protein [Allopusillimonas soli]TEA70101.1 hypothetical protein ERD78_18710 [Allopusillimonas soli]
MTALLVGCASVPSVNEAVSVNEQYVLQPDLLIQKNGTGQVTIIREGRPLHMYRTGVYVDGEMIATIAGDEALTIYLPVGRALIGTGPTSKASEPYDELAIDVNESQPTLVRFRLSAWGWGAPGGWEVNEASR